MNKPSIGRIVTARIDPLYNSGADLCPAIITRVWSDFMVNVKLFPDGPQDLIWKTSVQLYENEEAARNSTSEHAVFWPGRV